MRLSNTFVINLDIKERDITTSRIILGKQFSNCLNIYEAFVVATLQLKQYNTLLVTISYN